MRPFGIGFSNRGGRCIIKDVVPEKNADRAGVMKGDVIERINDCPHQTHEAMMEYLKGQPKHLSSRFVLSRTLKGKRAGLQAVISGAMNIVQKNNRFTIFAIAMNNKSGSWVVHKRYSEFENLHKQVGAHTSAKLPGKKLFGSSTDAAVVKERMVGLNEYLQVLLDNDAVSASDPVDGFLAKGQQLYPEDAVVEAFDSGLDSGLLQHSKDGNEKLSSLRRQAIAEAGKLGAKALANVSGALNDQNKALSSMEQRKIEIDTQLYENQQEYSANLKQQAALVTARQDMCNFLKTYSLKLHGVKSDFTTEHEQENRKMNRPTGRLVAELEDVQRNIVRIKDGLVELRAQRETQVAQDKSKTVEIQDAMNETERKHEARSRLKTHLSRTKAGIDEEIEEIKAAIDENETEAVNMTAFHHNMVKDSEELAQTQAEDKAKIEELETSETEMIAENDKAQNELRTKLQKVEADLGAWAEMEALRRGHEESMTSLRNQGAAEGNDSTVELVDVEMARSRVASEAEQKLVEESNQQREALINEMQELEATFLEDLKRLRSTMNAQVTSTARTDEYAQKVKGELEFAEDQLRSHNTEKSKHQEVLNTLQAESKSLSERIKKLDAEMVQLAQEQLQQQNSLTNHLLVAKGREEDLSEQIGEEEQVLNFKEETAVSTKQQLHELEGTPEQKGKFALLQAYVREVSAESDTIDAVLAEHETKKTEHEESKSHLDEEHKTKTELLEKESRDVQYRIEVDSRAMQLRADYAETLGSDVAAADNIQQPSSPKRASQAVEEDEFADAEQPQEDTA